MPHVNARRNKVGIPIMESRTIAVYAAYWGGNSKTWIPTTVLIPFTKNR
jgi:hypothetical protein